jgi:hypothetical protein
VSFSTIGNNGKIPKQTDDEKYLTIFIFVPTFLRIATKVMIREYEKRAALKTLRWKNEKTETSATSRHKMMQQSRVFDVISFLTTLI